MTATAASSTPITGDVRPKRPLTAKERYNRPWAMNRNPTTAAGRHQQHQQQQKLFLHGSTAAGVRSGGGIRKSSDAGTFLESFKLKHVNLSLWYFDVYFSVMIISS